MEFLQEEHDSVLEDSDFPKNFAKDFSRQIEMDTRETMEKVANIWIEMGLNSSRLEKRIDEIKSLFQTILKNSLQTENNSLQELIVYKETKLNEINAILNDLTLLPFVVPTDLSLMQISKLLYNKCNELLEVKNERMAQLTGLKSKRDNLCHILNMKTKPFKTVTNIPSEEELMHLQTYISDLSKEKAKRLNKYLSIKKIIELLFIDLEREVSTDFEKHLLFDETNKFILSDDNMKKLSHLHSELEMMYAKNKGLRKQMEDRLSALWNKLEVSDTYRDDFFSDKTGYKPSVLSLIREEVEKYEELKRQNIEIFVHKIRTDLEEWYEKCCFSVEQKDVFRPMIESNEFSEQLLDAHEAELQRLQSFYEECEQIFHKYIEWNELWNRNIELENKANDPNRFNNRGGALLAEEREKKQIHSRLPKLEKEMRSLSKEWFENTGQKFCIYGMEVEKYFEEKWNEYQKVKENEKKERQRVKQMEIQAQLKGKKATPIGGGVVLRKTPIKRAFTPIAANGGSTSKVRKVAPLTPSRLNNEINTNTITKGVLLKDPLPRARARNLQKQMNNVADTPNTNDGSCLSIDTIDEYEFQAPLRNQDNANSTFISASQRGTPNRHVTKRRERQPIRGMDRRRSRSCSDLVEAIDSKMQLNSRPMPSIRSTPVSPQVKTRGSRIAVPQRKRPFLV